MGDALGAGLQGFAQALAVGASTRARREDRESQDERFRLSFENQLRNTEIQLLKMDQDRERNRREVGREIEFKQREDIKFALGLVSSGIDPDTAHAMLQGFHIDAVNLPLLQKFHEAAEVGRATKGQENIEQLARTEIISEIGDLPTEFSVAILDDIQKGGPGVFTRAAEKITAIKAELAAAAAGGGAPGSDPSKINARQKSLVDFINQNAQFTEGSIAEKSVYKRGDDGFPLFHTSQQSAQYVKLLTDYEKEAGIFFTPDMLQEMVDLRRAEDKKTGRAAGGGQPLTLAQQNAKADRAQTGQLITDIPGIGAIKGAFDRAQENFASDPFNREAAANFAGGGLIDKAFAVGSMFLNQKNKLSPLLGPKGPLATFGQTSQVIGESEAIGDLLDPNINLRQQERELDPTMDTLFQQLLNNLAAGQQANPGPKF